LLKKQNPSACEGSAWRPHNGKGVGRLAVQYPLSRRKHTAGGEFGRGPGFGTGMRVGIQVYPLESRGPFDSGDIFRTVTKLEFGPGGFARRHLDERRALQAFGHFDHYGGPLRALRMQPAGKMIEIATISDHHGFTHR
jgi:hypothetical protein